MSAWQATTVERPGVSPKCADSIQSVAVAAQATAVARFCGSDSQPEGHSARAHLFVVGPGRRIKERAPAHQHLKGQYAHRPHVEPEGVLLPPADLQEAGAAAATVAPRRAGTLWPSMAPPSSNAPRGAGTRRSRTASCGGPRSAGRRTSRSPRASAPGRPPSVGVRGARGGVGRVLRAVACSTPAHSRFRGVGEQQVLRLDVAADVSRA